MAHKRMFSMDIMDSDAFLDMPHSTQILYVHLSMRADDDGFIGNPKRIMRMIGSQDDDLRILITKRFILAFDNGVCVVKHWRVNNTIRLDRYTETLYLEEKGKLSLKENKSYTDNLTLGLEPIGKPNGNQMATQKRIEKDRIEKNSKEKKKLFFENNECRYVKSDNKMYHIIDGDWIIWSGDQIEKYELRQGDKIIAKGLDAYNIYTS